MKPVRVPQHGRTEPLPVVDGIHFGSRWVLSAKGDSGSSYEVIPKREGDHPCDYRLRLVELGARANAGRAEREWATVGDEITVSPEWFTERARRAS